MHDSEIGVSRQRASPNRSTNPLVTPKAPPYDPTSWPRQNTAPSRSISSHRACRITSKKVTAPLVAAVPSPGSSMAIVDPYLDARVHVLERLSPFRPRTVLGEPDGVLDLVSDFLPDLFLDL